MTDLAFVIGESVPGDATVEQFQTTVLQLNYDLELLPDYAVARERLNTRSAGIVAGERDIVLFCIGPALQHIREHLEGLRAENRQTMVYAHPIRTSPQVAVEYCRCELVDDFLSWGEKVSRQRIEEHVKALHAMKSPYPRIDIALEQRPAQVEPQVFIATPYDRDYRMVMSDAVDPAIAAVHLKPCWADEPYRDSSVPDQVRFDIRESVLLIANIRQGPGAVHNPNVYYEAGQATALGIPVVFVRPADEKGLVVPADISGRRRIEYDSPLDLALRLYHGLSA